MASLPASYQAGWCAVHTRRRRNVSYRGQSLRRFEDARFLTGAGKYVEDIDYPNQAWMQVVRSPHAHARITDIDVAAARAVPA